MTPLIVFEKVVTPLWDELTHSYGRNEHDSPAPTNTISLLAELSFTQLGSKNFKIMVEHLR